MLLFIAIGWIFFYSQSNQHQELIISKMEINASNITHKIIQTHMQNRTLDVQNIEVDKDFKYGLYDYENRPIYTQIDEEIDFSKKFYKKNDKFFYINNGSVGHLGVYNVVIKESNLDSYILALLTKIVVIMFLLYVGIALIGFYLAKLFIYPIQSQREKLNNFIKDTTHEINTPLSALLLCVDSENFNSEQNRNHIRLSVKKMSNLYKDLTYLFLKEHHKKSIENTDISKILEDELDYFKQIATKKNININSNISKIILNIEEEDFSRLINNLISNAIKYTKRNGEIDIILRDNKLIVKDTGIGIQKDKLDKIFERYYRATDTTGGFGIGLSIVYSICKNYNIKIEVESELNKGTTFTLTF